MKSLSRVRLFATQWTVAHQAPPSVGFSRQACWSRLPFPSPGDLPDPGIKPGSPTLWTDALPSEPPGKSYYTVEVTDRLKRLNLIDRVPEELWMEVHNIAQEAVIKTIPNGEKNAKRQNVV